MVSRIVDLDGEEPRSDVELKRVQALLLPKWSIFEERVLCAFRAKRVDYLIARDILPTARGSCRSEALYLPGPPQSHPRGMAPSMGFVLGHRRHLAGILLMTGRDKTGFQGGSARDDDQGAQFQIGCHRSVRRRPNPISAGIPARISAWDYRQGYRQGYRQPTRCLQIRFAASRW